MSGVERWGRLLLLSLMIVCACAVAAGAADEELDSEACLACHGTEGFTGAEQQPLFVDSQAFAHSVHGDLPCTTCHQDATSIPHEPKLAAVTLDTCATCHSDEVDAYRRSSHGKARANGEKEAASCTDCHGNVHRIVPHTDPTSAAHWTNLAKTCAHCHANLDLMQRLQIPVVRPVAAYLQSVHARAVAAGRRGAECSDCHGSHLILPSVDPQSSIYRRNVPLICGACHKEVLAKYQMSVHGQALARGVTDAPVCTDCHNEHGILPITDPKSPVFAANVPSETCGRCHGDARMNEKYGIPSGNYLAFEDSFHGLALRAGKLSVANCASCHGVHDILPSSDPRSQVNPQHLPETCGKCHPGAGASFPLGRVHVSSSWKSGPASWIRLVYLPLIFLVIGGMLLHNFVDLGRKAVEPPPPAPPVAADEPERMPRVLRWQHGLVMITFPVLVYSGFALVYPESWWSTPLLHWGVDVRGLTHRVAAGVLLLSLLWHAGTLVANRGVRRCLGGMWPTWGDVRQFWGMIGYYLGRRSARALGGAFTYIEKAEYWAFVWGMLVMTLSGGLLWFADFSLRFLPKWVTDVATAIHFYEAVLASLAILVWHLYWVIFDPEVYPMDWSWWNGRSPASRVHERHLPEGGAETGAEPSGDENADAD